MRWSLLLLVALIGCPKPKPDSDGPLDQKARSFAILSINDTYRIEGLPDNTGGLARVAALRAQQSRTHPEVLVLHGGDLLHPSLMSTVFGGKQMVDCLNRLDGDAEGFDPAMFATFGNHEFDKDDLKDAPILQARVNESQFTWLHSNISFTHSEDGAPMLSGDNLITSKIIERNGIQVGLFSVSTDDRNPDYVASFADPAETARRLSSELRQQGAEVIVALTHLSAKEDQALLADLGADGPDLIIGGHDHQRLAKEVDGRWVLKADADAVTAVWAVVTVKESGPPSVKWEHIPLGPDSPEPDSSLQEVVAEWSKQADETYCTEKLKQEPGCLAKVLGHTNTHLGAEEHEIRKYETSLGNWTADEMAAVFADQGAQGAFIHGGTLRMNHDIPADSDIVQQDMEELLPYSAPLHLIRIRGDVLQQVLDHSVSGWDGSGHWLQISGFAYVHDPSQASATSLTLLGEDGPRPIQPDEELLLVTPDYLLNRKYGQDGYTMLDPAWIVSSGPTLKDVLVSSLQASSEGISPTVEGRICNAERGGPCLALTQ